MNFLAEDILVLLALNCRLNEQSLEGIDLTEDGLSSGLFRMDK